MKLTLVRRQHQTHNIESFYFKPAEPLHPVAGQYLHYILPHDGVDNRGDNRYFTISASPTETEIALTTKFSEPGSSFKRALQRLSIGQTIEADGLDGDFVLPLDPNQAVIFVAGGVGITPFRSMLKYIVDTNFSTPVHLIYGCRSERDIPFKDELDTWAASHPNIAITYVLGNASADWLGERGNLSGETILRLAGTVDNRPVYLSGPEPMVKSLKQQLIDAGVSPTEIKMDDFPGYINV